MHFCPARTSWQKFRESTFTATGPESLLSTVKLSASRSNLTPLRSLRNAREVREENLEPFNFEAREETDECKVERRSGYDGFCPGIWIHDRGSSGTTKNRHTGATHSNSYLSCRAQ